MDIARLYNKVENTFGSLKFAVIIIMVFTIFMIVGTFAESYYGTEFANRLIYKKWPFMLIQLVMYLSILMATFKRFPFIKAYYGFYTLHLGLLLIFSGSFVTYYSGIDGNITLVPGIPSRSVELPKDQVKLSFGEGNKAFVMDLPESATKQELNVEYKGIKFQNFLPYTENITDWVKSKQNYLSANYTLSNDMVAQNFTLTNNPEAKDFTSTLSLGPLSIHFLPDVLQPCFSKETSSKLIIWNANSESCFTPEDYKIEIKTTSKGNRFLVVPYEGNLISFFPDFSPYPVNEKFQIQRDNPLKIFSKKLFETSPHLFLFGNGVSYFEDGSWTTENIKTDESLSLPWMGFEVTLHRVEKSLYPILRPKAILPIQKNSEIVKGNQRAIELEYENKKYYVTDSKPIVLRSNQDFIKVSLQKQKLDLPFEFLLTNFKMDTDPGTNNPASYESFIQLFSGKEGSQNHHIYMNNPLKHAGFTFYQASYFKTENSGHGSVLSANFDPGRPIKYFGSLILVLGTMWHYLIRRKKKASFFSKGS